MYVAKGEVSLINSEISDCNASHAGGAVFVGNAKVSLVDSEVISCSADEVRM